MNLETVHYINIIFGLGAIGMFVLALLALILLLARTKESKYLAFIKKYFIEIGFLISFTAFLVSGFYSEILQYVPCKHCWIQRIFIVPQVLLFGIAWWRKDRHVFWYSWPLLLVGFADSLYLMFIYYFRTDSAPCDASGVSCVQKLVSEFGGSISIPSLAFMGFASLLIVLAVAHFYKKGE